MLSLGKQMKRIVFLAASVLVVGVVSARDLYLLVGQSNMAGRGKVTDANRLSSERVWKFTADERWAEGVEPIHYDRKSVGAGPGLAFARAMVDAEPSRGAAETGGIEIGLIPCAEGGSALSRWEPGKDLYDRAVKRAKAALATGGVLKGILWHQGEADSWKKEKAESYAMRLTNMVTQLRGELGAPYVPFIAGEVGLHYAESIRKRGGTPFVATVNAQIKAAVSSLPAAGWVSAEGLVPGADGIHFTTESAYELGRRFAAEMQLLQRYAKDEPPVAPMKVSSGNPRYFESAGRPFVPIGVNLCYCREADPTAGYLKWLDRFAANGGNYLRLWCGNAFWDVMPRFNEIDATVTARLRWMADECAMRRIRIKLTLEQFRGFGETQQPVFRKEIYAPYAKTMTDWFTNDVCQAAFRRKIDAIADAVGAHPAVAVIEIWNEIMADWGRIQTRWQTETLAYLRTKFPEKLVVANLGSFSESDSATVYDRICARADNDFLQVHRYYDPGAAMSVCYGPIDVLCADAIRELRDRRIDKPALLAETGAVKPNHTGHSELYAKDPEGVLMHDMVFAPFFAGAAGCGQMWHWDARYVDGNGLWWHYGRFAEAIRGLDPIAEDFKPFRIESKAYRAYGLRGKKTTVVWVRDKRTDALAEVRDGQTAETRVGWKIPLRANGPVDCYLPWEDRHVTAQTEESKICLPPFRRSAVLRFGTPAVR